MRSMPFLISVDDREGDFFDNEGDIAGVSGLEDEEEFNCADFEEKMLLFVISALFRFCTSSDAEKQTKNKN